MSFTRTGGRNAPSAFKLNRKSDFHDDMGMLKEGYSYEGGEGMVAMGEGKVGTTRGAGKDGMVGGTINKIIYGSLPEQKQAPAASTPEPEAPAPEPKKDKGPVVHSPEVAQAKERVNNYKGSIDGNAGSTFSTSAPTETPEPDAMANSVSFAPAEINTPAHDPNAGNAEQAQSFADKYKLSLINKGAGQSDFSGT